MTAFSNIQDIGAFSGASRLLLSSQTGDWNDDGASVDCAPDGAQRLGSGLVSLSASSAQAGIETCTVSLTLQDADDDGTGTPGAFADVNANILMGAADLADGLPANPVVTLTNAAGDADFSFTVPLWRLRRHVRVQTVVAQDNNANTANVSLHLVDGGNVLAPR